jgi:hypothetical protein
MREGKYLENPDFDGRVILKCIFSKNWLETWTGLVWFRTGTSGELL